MTSGGHGRVGWNDGEAVSIVVNTHLARVRVHTWLDSTCPLWTLASTHLPGFVLLFFIPEQGINSETVF